MSVVVSIFRTEQTILPEQLIEFVIFAYASRAELAHFVIESPRRADHPIRSRQTGKDDDAHASRSESLHEPLVVVKNLVNGLSFVEIVDADH
jgi:hypothetical protein